jgi:hypothetical protein
MSMFVIRRERVHPAGGVRVCRKAMALGALLWKGQGNGTDLSSVGKSYA